MMARVEWWRTRGMEGQSGGAENGSNANDDEGMGSGGGGGVE
jgi:hypothetical protein